jgi:5'-deoxynucleotidase YfbR-like HD superfamily hydrolase
MKTNAQGLVDIGRLVFQFARVNRVTYHEDGVTPESDTDHTVMLSVCACALGEKLYKDSLDLGLVAQFAIVHDLVEAYANDTDTFAIEEGKRRLKEEREHEAFIRIRGEFETVYPWIPNMIERYEQLDTKEARFVKTVDKLMHKITHILNKGAYFKVREMDAETMWNNYQMLTRTYEHKYGAEFPEILALMDELIKQSRFEAYGI